MTLFFLSMILKEVYTNFVQTTSWYSISMNIFDFFWQIPHQIEKKWHCQCVLNIILLICLVYAARKCGEDGAEPKEGSWTSLQDYGDLDNPILTHATELTVEQTQVCSKLFNCFHGEGLETGKEMMGKNSNQYNQTCIHLLFANI